CREAPKDIILKCQTEVTFTAHRVMSRAFACGVYTDALDPERETERALSAMCTWREVGLLAKAVDAVEASATPDLTHVPSLAVLRDRHTRYSACCANPAPINKVITTLDGCIHDSAMPRGEGVPDGALCGLGVSSGTITGTARVIKTISDGHRLQRGDILVAPYSDPGWTSVFNLAAGVVLEVGGNLTHGSVVARELGLPGVVSVAKACTHIPDGATITVDGTLGYVMVHAEEEEEGEAE
ncbi:hypothetical protein KIPB_010041, partial [Kipferlia bialata]